MSKKAQEYGCSSKTIRNIINKANGKLKDKPKIPKDKMKYKHPFYRLASFLDNFVIMDTDTIKYHNRLIDRINKNKSNGFNHNITTTKDRQYGIGWGKWYFRKRGKGVYNVRTIGYNKFVAAMKRTILDECYQCNVTKEYFLLVQNCVSPKKFTEADVRFVVEMSAEGKSYSEIGSQYGCSKSTVAKMVKGTYFDKFERTEKQKIERSKIRN